MNFSFYLFILRSRLTVPYPPFIWLFPVIRVFSLQQIKPHPGEFVSP